MPVPVRSCRHGVSSHRRLLRRCSNHPELQAFAELYCRKIEVYNASQPDAAPQDYMWHGVGAGEGAASSGPEAAEEAPRPIRLSYHNGASQRHAPQRVSFSCTLPCAPPLGRLIGRTTCLSARLPVCLSRGFSYIYILSSRGAR